MNKRFVEYEFLLAAKKLNPYFYKLGFTPNMLTILSFIFVLASVFMLYKDYRILAALFYLISYYFDCADGLFARKYNMVSEFGDLLDHLTDLLGIILLLFVFYIKNKNTFIKVILPLALFIIIISINDTGNTTLIREKEYGFKSKTVDFSKHLCFIRNKEFLYFFNISTCVLLVSFIMLFYK